MDAKQKYRRAKMWAGCSGLSLLSIALAASEIPRGFFVMMALAAAVQGFMSGVWMAEANEMEQELELERLKNKTTGDY